MIELGTLLLYQNDMTLVSIRLAVNEKKMWISSMQCINASLLRQLFEDYDYLLVPLKSQNTVFLHFIFCFILDHGII